MQLWLDTETTGLNPLTCSLWQIGAFFPHPAPHLPGPTEFLDTCNPDGAVMEPAALALTGMSVELFNDFQTRSKLWEKFFEFVRPFAFAGGKITICGYNIAFDKPFLEAFISLACADRAAFGRLFTHYTIDPYSLARILLLEGFFERTYGARPQSLRLGVLASFLASVAGLQIPALKAHSALDDAKLAYLVYRKLKEDFLDRSKTLA